MYNHIGLDYIALSNLFRSISEAAANLDHSPIVLCSGEFLEVPRLVRHLLIDQGIP